MIVVLFAAAVGTRACPGAVSWPAVTSPPTAGSSSSDSVLPKTFDPLSLSLSLFASERSEKQTFYHDPAARSRCGDGEKETLIPWPRFYGKTGQSATDFDFTIVLNSERYFAEEMILRSPTEQLSDRVITE